jgi:hypothetical protein
MEQGVNVQCQRLPIREQIEGQVQAIVAEERIMPQFTAVSDLWRETTRRWSVLCRLQRQRGLYE